MSVFVRVWLYEHETVVICHNPSTIDTTHQLTPPLLCACYQVATHVVSSQDLVMFLRCHGTEMPCEVTTMMIMMMMMMMMLVMMMLVSLGVSPHTTL